MQVVGKVSDNTLYIFLSGELDEHSAPAARKMADATIDANAACERAVFDLSGVRFMDSTGIGFLVGRYKRLRRYGIPAALQSVDFAADKVLAMSGIYALIPKL